MKKSTTTRTDRTLAGWLALATFWVAMPGLVQAGTLIDWLAFSPGADRNHFGLVNDFGQPLLHAQVDVAAGVLAPLSPAAGSLKGEFWTDPFSFTDSAFRDGTVSTVKVQIAPRAGAVQYQLNVRGADLSGMVIAVGQLFGSGGDGTREVGVLAKMFSGVEVALEYLGEERWDNGVRLYSEPLNWDGRKLSLDPTANGESGFAFFRVLPGSGPVTNLLFDVPRGYAVGAGDALEFAFGIPVPEPGAAAMLLSGLAGMAVLRRRRSGLSL